MGWGSGGGRGGALGDRVCFGGRWGTGIHGGGNMAVGWRPMGDKGGFGGLWGIGEDLGGSGGQGKIWGAGGGMGGAAWEAINQFEALKSIFS